MMSNTTKLDSSQPAAGTAVHLFDDWFDPIESGVRDRVRAFIHAMIEGELDMSLSRPRLALAVRSRRAAMAKARSAPPVTATATARGGCWEASAGWRSPCRAPD